MPIRICSLLATLLVLGLQPAFAGDVKPSEESVRHLFEVMNTRHLLDDMMGQVDKTMRESARTALGGKTLNPKQQKIFDDMMTKLVDMMKEQVSWPQLEPMMISVYRDTFTPQEVDALAGFYGSPTGQAIANKLPLATQRSMQLMQDRMRGMIPRIGELEKQTAEQMKQAADPDEQPAPAPH